MRVMKYVKADNLIKKAKHDESLGLATLFKIENSVTCIDKITAQARYILSFFLLFLGLSLYCALLDFWTDKSTYLVCEELNIWIVLHPTKLF